MSLCINPDCQNPKNLDNLLFCQSCGSELLLEGRYRVMLQLGSGGFSKTFEVSDRHTTTPKILKLLTENQSKAVELFQLESQVLTQLNHPGIPKAELYFTFKPGNSQELLHCLVMEKIEGLNLQEWLGKRGNRPISEKQALDWLTQLADILHEVHQQQLFHRDIKPSNIMLKADGQLVLIDFGIVRQITATYPQKQAAGQITRYYSPGYAPLEQEVGRAVPQSDFFALGRTFVYLLTGKHPQDIGTPYRDPNTDDNWNWRDEATQISPLVADFIDHLMARSYKNRPADTQAILQRLTEIDQILHPRKLSSPKSSKQLGATNKQKIVLERTLGSLYSGHSGGVLCVAISPDGKTLVSGSADYTIKLWNLNTGDEIHTLTGHSGEVISLAISPDGQTLVSGSFDTTIKMWDIATGKEIRTLSGHSYAVNSLAISSDGQTLFSGSHQIYVWKLTTGEQIRTLPVYSGEFRSIAISPDGQTLVIGSDAPTINVWSICSLTGHVSAVNSLAISSNGETLVSGSDDKTIKVWNLNTKEEIRTLTGHSEAISSIAISSDGQTLVSGSEDETIKVWNLSSGEEMCNSRHSDGVTAVAFSPDGQILVSGSMDSTIKVWRIQ